MKENNDQFLIVPKALLDQILESTEKILTKLNGDSITGKLALPADYMTEAQAKKMLDRGTTWFWNMRKDGFLPWSKLGGKNYYRKQDIQKLLDSAFTGNRK